MATWQPPSIIYPDAELVLTGSTRQLIPGITVDTIMPRDNQPAITWNRIGGNIEAPFDMPLMQCRVQAPTLAECNQLVSRLLAVLPSITDGDPVTVISITGGPTDLGEESAPMKQLLFDITLRGTQHVDQVS